MRNLLAALVLILCPLFSGQSLAQSCARNLMSNAGFDMGSAKGWHTPTGEPGASAGIAPDGLAHSGGAAFALRAASVWQSVRVMPGIKYTMRVWARATSGDNSAYIHFNIFSATGPLGSELVYVNSPDYQEYTLEVVAPANAVRIDASATAAGPNTALFVDDFYLTEGFARPAPGDAALLCNGGFEESFSGWEGWVSGYSRTASAGLQSVSFCSNQDFCQTVAVRGGERFRLQFKSQACTIGARVIGYLKFLSADNRPLAWQSVELEARDCPYWGMATFTETAPGGTAWAEVGFFMEKQGCVLVDEVQLFAEPSEDRTMPTADSTAAEAATNLRIFPNPAHESAFVDVADFEGMENLRLVIFDSKGLIVKDLSLSEMASPLTEISFFDLPNGIYFAHLIAPGLRPKTAKLVVQHTF